MKLSEKLYEIFDLFRRTPTLEEIYEPVRERNARVFEEQVQQSMENWKKEAEEAKEDHSSRPSSQIPRLLQKNQKLSDSTLDPQGNHSKILAAGYTKYTEILQRTTTTLCLAP